MQRIGAGAGRDADRITMAQMYRDGATVRAVAAAHGRSFGWTYERLREAGVTFRPRGRVTTCHKG